MANAAPIHSRSQEIPSKLASIWQCVNDSLSDALQFPAGCPERLNAAMRYSVLAPGKRLRPTLVLLAFELVGGKAASAIPAACAVELIHAYSLVHDDLPAMDDDDLRRGRPTCHRQFDEATAILVGDALQARAYELLAALEPPEVAARCVARMAHAAGAAHLVGGQMDDLTGTDGVTSLEQLQAIHRRKTGAMFLVSLELGTIIGGGNQDDLDRVRCYGENYGLAFQITDDLLDVAGDEQKVGKRVGKDADHGKLTYPGLLGVDASHQHAATAVAAARDALTHYGPAAQPLDYLVASLLERDR
jgi:geranylgeranyl diphosphate synthase, type II